MRSMIVLLNLLVLLLAPIMAEGQVSQPPPSYGELTSPFIQNYEIRELHTFQLRIPLLVPRSELAAILPAGFQPLSQDPATITLSFAFQVRSYQRVDLAGVPIGTYGPTSHLSIFTAANSTLGRNEVLSLVRIASTQAGVDRTNTIFGPGSSRLGEIEVELEEKEETLKIGFDVDANELKLSVKAWGSANIVNRLIYDPYPLPYRFLDGKIPRDSFWLASQTDSLNVPTAGYLDLEIPSNQLHLPGGTLSVLGVSPTMMFLRWFEDFVKLE